MPRLSQPLILTNRKFYWNSIRTNDCIFNPITRAPTKAEYKFHLRRVLSPYRSSNVGPSFDVMSIATPENASPVTTPVNCGAKEVVAQVISTVDKKSIVDAAEVSDSEVSGKCETSSTVWPARSI